MARLASLIYRGAVVVVIVCAGVLKLFLRLHAIKKGDQVGNTN